MPNWDSISQAVKTAGKIAAEHHETIAQGAQMGIDAKAKKNKEKDAKKSFQDYLLWKNRGQPDIEEFAYERAEISGRTWNEIADNIRFHMERRGESVPQHAMQLMQPVSMEEVPGECRIIVDSLFASKGKDIPDDFPDEERQWVRYICGYQDIAEYFGYEPVIESDVPKEDIRKLADLLGKYANYGKYLAKDLLSIVESEDSSLRDFPVSMQEYLRQGLAKFVFKKFISKDNLVNLCLDTGDASYRIISDKIYRALLVAYNKERK